MQTVRNAQLPFPSGLLQAMNLKLVGGRTLGTLLARACSIFAPVFVPVLEQGNGDLITLHCTPGIPWQRWQWIQLPHDGDNPILISTALEFLPGALLVPPLWCPNRVEEIWPEIVAFVAAVGSTLPDRELFEQENVYRAALRAAVDPGDSAARVAEIVRQPGDPGPALEELLQDCPNDVFVLVAIALKRKASGGDAQGPARQALGCEVASGFNHALTRLITVGSSPAELLEKVRPIGLDGIGADSPFALLADTPYTHPAAAERLIEVADRLRVGGDEGAALTQLRNGCAVAGWTSGDLDRRWCDRLAEQSERVEPGGLSAALARHAGDVIERGP